MEPDQDIRAQALLDQLNEIDRRIQEVKDLKPSKRHRTIRTGLLGISVTLMALFFSNLEGMGVGPVVPAAVLFIGYLGSGPLFRLIVTLGLEREKDRVLALHEEIDRRLALSSGGPDKKGEVN